MTLHQKFDNFIKIADNSSFTSCSFKNILIYMNDADVINKITEKFCNVMKI